jgi:hypothetical protein
VDGSSAAQREVCLKGGGCVSTLRVHGCVGKAFQGPKALACPVVRRQCGATHSLVVQHNPVQEEVCLKGGLCVQPRIFTAQKGQDAEQKAAWIAVDHTRSYCTAVCIYACCMVQVMDKHLGILCNQLTVSTAVHCTVLDCTSLCCMCCDCGMCRVTDKHMGIFCAQLAV